MLQVVGRPDPAFLTQVVNPHTTFNGSYRHNSEFNGPVNTDINECLLYSFELC
jgi:hypothetical protein